jgi:hypothetical protein
LSGSNPHRVSPGPSETSSRPGRSSSIIPPVRTMLPMPCTHFNFQKCEPQKRDQKHDIDLFRSRGSHQSTSRPCRCCRLSRSWTRARTDASTRWK